MPNRLCKVLVFERKPLIQAVLKYLFKLFACNIVGAFTSVAAAFVIFSYWDTADVRTFTSLLTDAFQVSFSLLLPVGLMYSVVLITPLFVLLRKKYWLSFFVLLIVAVLPGIVILGSMYWDILALSFGLATFLSFSKVVLTNEN